jgi:tetratricopeptide (TPR) repeat protein
MKYKSCTAAIALVLIFAFLSNSINVLAQDGGDIIGGASGDISGGSSVFYLRGARKKPQRVSTSNSYFVRSLQSRNEERSKRIQQSQFIPKPKVIKYSSISKNKAAVELIAAAQKYLAEKDLSEAETGFYEAAQLDPNNTDAKTGLASVYAAYGDNEYNAQKYERAILYYEKSNGFDQTNADTYASLGDAYDALKKQDKAISSYEQALNLNPKLTALYGPLGKLYFSINNYKEAKAYLEKTLDDQSKDTQFLYVYGATLFKLNEYENSLPILQKAVALDPGNPEAHYYLGKTYALLNDTKSDFQEKAIDELNKAAQLKPKYAEAYFDLGVVHFNRSEYEKAASSYNQALEANSNYPEARLNLAETYRLIAETENKPENYGNAVNHYQIAISYKQYTEDPDVLAKFGFSLGKTKDWTRSIAYLQKAVDKQPDAVNYTNLSWALYGNKNYQAAVEAAQEAINRNSNFAAAYYNLGKAQAVLKNYEASIQSFKKALETRTNWTDAQINLGLVYGIKGDWQAAATAQQKAVQMQPNSAEAHYFLGIAEYNLGNKKNAERERDALQSLNIGYAQRLNLMINPVPLKRKGN